MPTPTPRVSRSHDVGRLNVQYWPPPGAPHRPWDWSDRSGPRSYPRAALSKPSAASSQEDLNARKNEELQLVIERANKVVKSLAETEKYDLILQESVYVSR